MESDDKVIQESSEGIEGQSSVNVAYGIGRIPGNDG